MSNTEFSPLLPFRPIALFAFLSSPSALGGLPTMTLSTLEHASDDAGLGLRDKLLDALVPGFAAEFDPDEAQRAGAFVEDALTAADAADSAIDLDGAWAFHVRQEA